MRQNLSGQAGTDLRISSDAFMKAVRDELIEHFRWTSVEGLVELEAASIAWNVLRRARDASSKAQTEVQTPMPMRQPPVTVLETINGSIQLSAPAGVANLGLLVDRDGRSRGLLLSPDTAEQLAELLKTEARLRRSPADQSADG